MKELYTTAQAAAYLDLSISTVKYHVYQGNLKPEKPGHDLIFTKAMLDEFNENKRRGPGRPRKRKEVNEMEYKVVKVNGKWNVIDGADGSFVASFTTKWEAEDFAAEMNEQDERQ